MITKYRASFQITQVECEKETASTVWINGRQHRKISDWESYHDTFEEAKAHMIEKAQKQVTKAASTLEFYEKHLEKVKALTLVA